MRFQAFRPNSPALAALLLLATAAFGQEKNPVDDVKAEVTRSGFALTIYSSADPASFDPKSFVQNAKNAPGESNLPGYGVVRDLRKLALKEGENTVKFTDVATGIDPTTVSFKSKTAPNSTTVLEQDYEYDLVSGDKILEKYLGQGIAVEQKNQGPFQGTLLSAEPGMLVLQGPGGLKLIPRGQDLVGISLKKLPEGLITKPTLVWKVSTDKAGVHDVEVSYQTDGLTWRADYNLVVAPDDKKADVGAWVSILNESGASYPGAKLKLVAGDVQRIQPQQQVFNARMGGMGGMAASAPLGFQEKTFFEYHLYTLGRPTSLADHSTKQIELFPAKTGVPVEMIYVYYGQDVNFRGFIAPAPNPDRNFGTQSNKKIDIYLNVKNDEASGLGIPMPAGRVRVYKKDAADAALEFVGEDTIQHTPKNEELLVKLGSAFDVVGERKQVNFEVNQGRHLIIETIEIRVRNHKTVPVKVIVKENLYRWLNWEIIQKSADFVKQDARTAHFPVDVPADGEKVITYTVRYTW